LWLAKFAANVERFERQREALLDAGWLPIVVWECELRRKGPQWAVAFVQAACREWAEWAEMYNG
jgi:G:T-mismatch repair DNA endonuclease (very short patch repair protein)